MECLVRPKGMFRNGVAVRLLGEVLKTHRRSLHLSTTTQKTFHKATDGKIPAQQDSSCDTDLITPWSVASSSPKGIDYSRVLTRFKAQEVDKEVILKLLEVINARIANARKGDPMRVARIHPFFARQVVFSHRDFDCVLTDLKKSFDTREQNVYLYTGRGPSSNSIHLGHFVPFLLTKYLQDVFDLPLVIQITDDEKYLFRDLPFTGKVADEMICRNIKDIIAFGFNPRRTFIFRNTLYLGDLYATVLRLQKAMTCNAVKHTMGIQDDANIGRLAFPATQAAPCFASAFPRVLPHNRRTMRCLIPCAIDQDPFFMLARAAASKMGQLPPALLHTKFLPALRGVSCKMSSSASPNTFIAANDTDAEIHKKIAKAFSGGKATRAEMQEQGADLDVDVAYQILKFFSSDEDLFGNVTQRYRAGKMDSGEVKKLAANVLIEEVLLNWRERRVRVTDKDVEEFCAVRNILA